MCRTPCVLALLALCLGLAHSHSFSWDFVVAKEARLDFVENNKVKFTEQNKPPAFIDWVAYDPVHNRVLTTTNHNWNYFLTSYDVGTEITNSPMHLSYQLFVKDYPLHEVKSFAYDPITEIIFACDENSLYSFELKLQEENKVNGTIVINLKKNEGVFREAAVDSCRKYIYWISNSYEIERTPYDGSNREVILSSNNKIRLGLNIERQKMYWIEYSEIHLYTIESADLNGNDQTTLYTQTNEGHLKPVTLTVSKDFIYWANTDRVFWKLSKNRIHVRKEMGIVGRVEEDFHYMAAYYDVEELNRTIQECEALKRNIGFVNVPKDRSLLCVHGTKVSEKNSLCNCTLGYTGERCDVSVCQNYCFQGQCIVNAEGQPKCRCNTNYSGTRCESTACYNYCLNNGYCLLNEINQPVCHCSAKFDGDRCEVPIPQHSKQPNSISHYRNNYLFGVSICQNYCVRGDCSVSAEGQPQCRCNAGYSGDRCESNACHNYCLDNGVCSLNETSKPVCQCSRGFTGERCNVSDLFIKCVRTVSTLKDILKADLASVTLGRELESTCASTVV